MLLAQEICRLDTKNSRNKDSIEEFILCTIASSHCGETAKYHRHRKVLRPQQKKDELPMKEKRKGTEVRLTTLLNQQNLKVDDSDVQL